MKGILDSAAEIVGKFCADIKTDVCSIQFLLTNSVLTLFMPFPMFLHLKVGLSYSIVKRIGLKAVLKREEGEEENPFI